MTRDWQATTMNIHEYEKKRTNTQLHTLHGRRRLSERNGCGWRGEKVQWVHHRRTWTFLKHAHLTDLSTVMF